MDRVAVQPGRTTWKSTCRDVGKSRIGLAYHQAAIRIFGTAPSGQAVIDEAFGHGARWLVDIAVATAGGRRIAIEHDGA